ncbi:MAG: carboxypeptidase-like regulatory domain-containing protein [Archangium sp.]
MRTTLIVLVILTTGCGAKECVLSDPNSCPADFACETVAGRDKPLCFRPVTITGKVFDLSNSNAIKGAEVLATDENGAPAGAAATTGDDGKYSLRIPSPRSDDKGTLTGRNVRLQSQAKNFVPFPSGARISLPISTSSASRENEDKPYVVSSALTDIGLSPVDASQQGLPSVSGKATVSDGQSAVLVLLESTGQPSRTTLAAADGSFRFFNVGAGTVKLSAWTKGQNYTPVDVAVASSDVTDVKLEKAGTGAASLSGKVQLVAGANGAGTSVVLVIESTFIESLGRGTVVPGLRAPENGPPTLTGDFAISGIPDGKYVVLAAFENDGNVRDPDPGSAARRFNTSP